LDGETAAEDCRTPKPRGLRTAASEIGHGSHRARSYFA
jgi:hypothetical protein